MNCVKPDADLYCLEHYTAPRTADGYEVCTTYHLACKRTMTFGVTPTRVVASFSIVGLVFENLLAQVTVLF